ncbi:MAG: hypothetical protein ACYTG5_19500 [Planctomycetota bacterium]|jgi:hypothetical protein
MFKDFFSSSDLLSLPVLSMLMFIAVFACAVAWSMARKRKSHYERMSRLPLEED